MNTELKYYIFEKDGVAHYFNTLKNKEEFLCGTNYKIDYKFKLTKRFGTDIVKTISYDSYFYVKNIQIDKVIKMNENQRQWFINEIKNLNRKQNEITEKSTKMIYVGGKVSGLDVSEYTELFNLGKRYVQENRNDILLENVITPIDICQPDWTWRQSMDVCLEKLKQCDEVYFLPNWIESNGAYCEKTVSELLNIPITYIKESDLIKKESL